MLGPVPLRAQVVEVDPVFPKVSDHVTITFTATAGNGALAGISPVYAHTGLITSESQNGNDWKHVQGVWGTPDPRVLMQSIGDNKHTIQYTIKDFYGLGAGETVQSMAFVFRNAAGTVVGRAPDGSDIFYPVYPDDVEFQALFLAPQSSSLALVAGETIRVKAATSQPADLALADNGEVVATASGELLDYMLLVSEPGNHLVEFTAIRGTDTLTRAFAYTVVASTITEDPPPGRKDGFTRINDTTAYFQLYAPGKAFVHLVGDMSDWALSADFQMKRAVDGTTWWLEVGGLASGQGYAYQYVVDGSLRIGDPYSTLVLDNFNDGFISEETFPDMPSYPFGLTSGMVSYAELAPVIPTPTLSPKPAREDLIVYEMLLRDFLAAHAYDVLTDTLDYLHRLGVNAIELMPVQEFEGNLSWGYNPSYHMALDKYYGSPASFRRFIEDCHARGIAVILDVVFNHAFGQSPLAQLYWDATMNRPAADNPWLNPVARHDFNVGFDFNHERSETRRFVKRVLAWWMETYGIDGFRFDLSKGFTQKNTLGNVAAWGAYDQSRIDILQDYADHVWAIDPEAYVILEHFAANDEEKELAARGMMLWGNMNFVYGQASMGYGGSDLSGTWHVNRGWSEPHLIGYMESHDEERIMYKNLTSGNSGSGYTIRALNTALSRIELANTFLYLIPGPKMLWQFGELGYDYSINTCQDGTVNNNCRLDPKPIRWEYAQVFRRQRIYDVLRAILRLRQQDAIRQGAVDMSLASQFEKRIRFQHTDMDIIALGNFHIGARTVTPGFTRTGWWYDYLSGDSLLVSDMTMTLTYSPGEYHIYTSDRLTPGFDITSSVPVVKSSAIGLRVEPTLTSGEILITLAEGIQGDVDIEVYTIAGQPILSVHTTAEDHHAIRLPDTCPEGVLLLIVHTRVGMAVVRIIKL